MDQLLKQRVVGAAVLVALGIIFIPIFLDEAGLDQARVESHELPQSPGEGFSSRVVPLNEDDVTALEQAAQATAEQLLGPSIANEDGTPGGVSEMPSGQTEEKPPQENPRTGVVAWVVQVGSFTSIANAQALEKRLRANGYKSFLEKLNDETGISYRVRIGPELAREKAEEIRGKLSAEINTNAIVIRYP